MPKASHAAVTASSCDLLRLRRHWQPLIFLTMDFKDGSTLIADLTTIGRKTGQPRTVELRLVYHNGSYYASSSKVNGKHWCQNMIKNPAVEITVRGNKLACTASQVSDDKLRQEILSLRDSPPRMDRVVFEITRTS
jgi:deazaflavin-dependent oxidoreductase (nitroreductase family)